VYFRSLFHKKNNQALSIKRLLFICFIASILSVNYVYGQKVVVSSYFNSTSLAGDEWTELLVIEDNTDMRNWSIRDNGGSQTAAAWQIQVDFKNIVLWNHLRAGTVILIWHRMVGSSGTHVTDVNKVDGYIQVSANDPLYFNGGDFTETASLSIGATGDIIQLRDGSGTHIHALGHRVTPGPVWSTLPDPWLNHDEALVPAEAVSVCPGSNLADYGTPHHDGTTYTSKSTTLLTQGLPNQCASSSTANSDYWRSLRQPLWPSPVLNATFTPPSTTVLSWPLAATDPWPTDLTQGYMILRNTVNSFTAPTDGTTYIVGNPIGSATVIAIIASSQTLTYTDNFALNCGDTAFYQVYAYRYVADQLNGNSYNVARGRAYNETNFGAANVGIPDAPAISSVTKTDATCGLNNGSITINATGLGGTLQYSIDNGVTWQTSNVFNNLAPGTYYVVVKDANGCLTAWLPPVVIGDFPAPTITQVDKTDATCGNDNGSITITAAGGTPPLQYSIDNGSNWQTSNVFLNLAAGTYNVMIKDANDCQVSFITPVVIVGFPGPTLSQVTKTDASCGNNNGSITVTASGGTAPLEYSKDGGTTWQTSNVFLNLAPGSYTVIIRDANNCQVPYPTPVVIDMIPSPVAPTSAIVDRNNLCADDAGNIILTAIGGSGLALEWFTGSCGGTSIGSGNDLGIPSPAVTTTYWVYWTSAICGNSTCASVTVNVTDPPTVSNAGPDQSLCGVYTTTLAGNQPVSGAGLWTQVSGPGSTTFANNTLYNTQVTVTTYGTYVYRWTISTGTACPVSEDDVSVSFGDAIIVVAASNSPVCTGTTITLTSSISGATYSWTGPNGFTSTQQNPSIPNATMASAGDYIVVVTNIPGGCPTTTDTTTVSMIASPVAPVSVVADPDTICADYTGTITLTSSGGSGDILFWYSDVCNGTVVGTGNGIDIPAPTVTTSYFASWTSSACGNSACVSTVVTVLDPPTPSNAGTDQSLCGVLSTILAANNPVNGTGLWTVVTGPGSVTFANPAAYNSQVTVTAQGNYTLRWTISANSICAASSDDVDINFGDAIQVMASSNSPVCSGNDINLTSSISGATYSWTGPNGFTSNLQNPVVPNAPIAAAGTYDVSVTNIPGGCPPTSGSTDVLVPQTPAVPTSATADPMEICADYSGIIILHANGGTGKNLIWYTEGCGTNQEGIGVEIHIPPPAVTTTYYALWTSDDCGNSQCASVTVTVYEPPTPAVAGGDQSVCNVLSTALEANTPVVGTGQWTSVSGPGSVSFSNSNDPNSVVIVSQMGIYTLRWTISTPGLCSPRADDVTIEFGDQITVSGSSNSPVCEGDSIALFSSISGATYAWTGPDGFTSNLQNPVIYNSTSANSGDYFITVSNIPGGCPTSSGSTTVEVSGIPAAPGISSANIIGSQQDVCEGSTVTYSIVSPGAGSDYTWDLSGGGNIMPTGSADVIDVQWFATSGSYDLTVSETNVSGCIGNPALLTVNILPLTPASITIFADNNPACAGSAVQFTTDITGGGTSPAFTWKKNGVTAGSDSVFTLTDPLDNDSITCELSSSSPCADPALVVSNSIKLDVLDSLKIDAYTEPEPICAGTPTVLSPGDSFASYLWSDGSIGPSITVEDAGIYWVMVTDASGCIATDTVLVEPCETSPVLYAPNAFTPNADGWNDRFTLVCSSADVLTEYEINIYSRWGQLLYSSNDIGEGWDGMVNGSPCQPDVYTYLVHYSFTVAGGGTNKTAGTFTLIR
jgi:gliding motility-associated-like protein